MEPIQLKYKSFCRDISFRNRIEMIAASTLAIFFFIMPFVSKSASLAQGILSFEVGLSALFIIYYIRKNGRIGKERIFENNHECSLSFLKDIEIQLKLLRSARWWYVLPITSGLVGLQIVKLISLIHSKNDVQEPIVVIAVIICVSLFVVFLNEVYGVNKLNKLKQSIQSEVP